MSQVRKQAKQSEAGDRILIPLKLAFEVQAAAAKDGLSELQLVPVSCGPKCPANCGCQSELLHGHDGPFRLNVDAKRKLEYLGNLSELLETLKQTQARIARLQTQDSSNGSAEKSSHASREAEVDA